MRKSTNIRIGTASKRRRRDSTRLVLTYVRASVCSGCGGDGSDDVVTEDLPQMRHGNGGIVLRIHSMTLELLAFSNWIARAAPTPSPHPARKCVLLP